MFASRLIDEVRPTFLGVAKRPSFDWWHSIEEDFAAEKSGTGYIYLLFGMGIPAPIRDKGFASSSD